jgi:lipid-A-disaccharide synthase
MGNVSVSGALSPSGAKVLLLAGEESGVVYAEALAAEIRRRAAVEIRGYGDCGFKTADLAVMGFWPVVRKLFFFLRVAREMKRTIREWRPDVVVTVDYPGLNLKLAAYAKKRGIPAVHLVCPQVWAWHRNRIPKVAAALSKLLCFFPFEPELFAGTGLDAKFIGHPLADAMARELEDSGAAAVRDPGLVALLPGSRIGEIQRHLPVLIDAAGMMAAKGAPAFRCEIPAANARAEGEIRRILASRPAPVPVTVISGGARDLLRRASCAAVASGTATLEAAIARCPTVLVYSVSVLLAWFARRVIKGVRHVGLINIIAEKCAVPPPMPELLQEAFTPRAVAELLEKWLVSAEARVQAVSALEVAMACLASDGRAIETAASEVLECVGGSGT